MKRSVNLPVWLWLLTSVFVFRVFAQLTVLWFEVPFLPPFERWYSGALPYPILLGFQFLVIAVMVRVSFKIGQETMTPNVKTGDTLLGVGLVYFSVMFVRWIIGITDVLDIVWFQRPIPSFFHMLLACFLLLVAYYHRFESLRNSR